MLASRPEAAKPPLNRAGIAPYRNAARGTLSPDRGADDQICPGQFYQGQFSQGSRVKPPLPMATTAPTLNALPLSELNRVQAPAPSPGLYPAASPLAATARKPARMKRSKCAISATASAS